MIEFINTNFINTDFINTKFINNVNVKNKGLNNRFVNTFKSQHTFIERIRESERILIKYPDRIPVIVDNDYNSTLIKLDKSKYLVPSNITILQFMFVLRKRFKIEKDCALFMFINGIIPASNSLMSEIYFKYKDDDQFLYIILKTESTFGSIV